MRFAAFRPSGVAAFPPSATLVACAPPVMDQRQSNSCTGHGGSGGAYTACAAKGNPLPFVPSQRGVYGDARCEERTMLSDGSLAPLKDEGATIADVIGALEKSGVRKMGPLNGSAFSDVTAVNVNDPPTLAEDEESARDLLVGAYAIANGSNLGAHIADAIANHKAPVIIGVYVDTAFEQWGENASPSKAPLDGAPDASDPNGGGHCMYIIGYRTESTGSLSFQIRNSWGPDIGVHGDWWVTERWLAAALWEAYALDVTPKAAS